jgi:LAO/AO transport system kinase
LASPDRGAIEDLASRVRSGDRRALSRAISWIEDKTDEGRILLDLLYAPLPRAHRVGITGPPGAGKSSLVNELARLLRQRGEQVGILAVDPSSPFTGGAILGDRIRMQSHYGDPGVFIRSMASRGSLGGLASTTHEASEAIEAAGFDRILIETVGVGQSEMEVVEAADTTVLVLVPESGDAVQVMKAGLMEAGDVFVINKSDREGGDRLQKEISLLFDLARERKREGPTEDKSASWDRRICRTVATRGEGIEDLLEGIDAHRAFLRADPERWAAHCEQRLSARLRTHLRDRLLQGIWSAGHLDEWMARGMDRIRRGEISPYAVVDEFVERLLRGELAGGRESRNGGER